ncbi:MAG: hypothetical protein ACRYFK_21040 [Janthinobacterium lividum]
MLLSLASTVNQLAGGRALVHPSFHTHLTLGGVTAPLVQQQLRGPVQAEDYRTLGNHIADSLRRNPAVNRWVDYQDAKNRNDFTERLRHN